MHRSIVLFLLLLLLAGTACADVIISIDDPHVAAGAPVAIKMMVTNDGAESMVANVPAPVHIRFETDKAVATLEMWPDRSGMLVIAPGRSATITLNGVVPAGAAGTATLSAAGMRTNALALRIDEKTTVDLGGLATAPSDRETDQALVDKPPPLAVSVYDPVYFIVGGDGGLNAKFQISLRYRLFDDRGPLARRLRWIDELYLSYSQTSLWDLGELSKPFTDSSYRPRLFYSHHDLVRSFDGRVRLGFEAGVGHESNGRAGAESRSFNMIYARPTVIYGDPDGFRLWLEPLIHNYISAGDNPDLKDYRGYVDWQFGAGSKGGFNFWALLRKGARSDFGSAELNLSYPLSKLSGGDLNGWLLLQYFAGYGESLLEYSSKLDSQLRLGFAVAL